jgi:hypothetical protein
MIFFLLYTSYKILFAAIANIPAACQQYPLRCYAFNIHFNVRVLVCNRITFTRVLASNNSRQNSDLSSPELSSSHFGILNFLEELHDQAFHTGTRRFHI